MAVAKLRTKETKRKVTCNGCDQLIKMGTQFVTFFAGNDDKNSKANVCQKCIVKAGIQIHGVTFVSKGEVR